MQIRADQDQLARQAAEAELAEERAAARCAQTAAEQRLAAAQAAAHAAQGDASALGRRLEDAESAVKVVPSKTLNPETWVQRLPQT